ncbi:TonB-dependent receptor [Pseudoalteromonas phenolica]|nr:TonB-dependent receptor [Pseudoalteromonas phenolica]MBE0353424.1 iron complex outermembrane recepter protein [Pseudoalteromonas phenolica O-BC30]
MEMPNLSSKKVLSTLISVSLIQPFYSYATDSIEVIEVYAQKRKQLENKVSITVNQIKGEQINNTGLKDTTDLGLMISGLKISQNAAEGTPPAINIRGVGLIDYNTANTSPIAIYSDGASVGSANNQLLNLFDIEQVEVLKGPQGTLFGRNSTGGAILIRSKRPDAGDYGQLTIGAGTDALYKSNGFYNLQIDDTSALRASFNHNRYDYTSHNIYPTSPEAGMEQNDFRLSYLGQWEKIEWYLKLNYSHWNGIAQPVGNIGIYSDPTNRIMCSVPEINAGKCVDAFGFNDGVDDFWVVSVNNDSPHHGINKGWTSELNWQIRDEVSVIWLNSFNRLDRQHAFNCDGSPARLCEGQLGVKSEVLNNEIRLNYELGDDHLTLGLFSLHERIYQNNYNDILRDLRGTEFGANSANFFYDNDLINKSFAIFGQYDWQIKDDLIITTGLRYSDEVFEYDSLSNINVVVDTNSLEGVLLPFYHVIGKVEDDDVSGKFAIIYSLSNNHSIFYNLSNGYKSGGYNGGYLSSPEQAMLADYGPEEIVSNEIGGKFINDDKTLKLNWALYHYNYTGQQVFMNQPSAVEGAPPIQLLENVGNSKIYGTDIDVKYRLTDTLNTSLGLSYIPHAEFESFIDPLGNVLTDNRLPFTSEVNISGAITYNTNFESNIDVSTTLGFDYQSDYYFDQNQNILAQQPSYTLWYLNSQVAYEDYQVRFWVKNLFDKEYSHLKFDLSSFLGMLEDFKGEGRRVGLEVSYNF